MMSQRDDQSKNMDSVAIELNSISSLHLHIFALITLSSLPCSKRISFVSVEQCRQIACQSLNEMSPIVGMGIIQDR